MTTLRIVNSFSHLVYRMEAEGFTDTPDTIYHFGAPREAVMDRVGGGGRPFDRPIPDAIRETLANILNTAEAEGRIRWRTDIDTTSQSEVDRFRDLLREIKRRGAAPLDFDPETVRIRHNVPWQLHDMEEFLVEYGLNVTCFPGMR